MDVKLAYQLARVSAASYLSDIDQAEDLLRSFGFEECAFFNQNDTQAVYCRAPLFDVIGWRGTEFTAGVKADIFANLYQNSVQAIKGGLVQRGYYKGAYELVSVLKPLVEERDRLRPIFFTGHSMGGVLATIAASFCMPAAVYSFGSPKPGDPEFWTTIRCPVYRVVNREDPAPFWPFISTFQQGGELWEMDGKEIQRLNWRFRPWVAGLPWSIPYHSVDLYVSRLSHLAGARLEIHAAR